MERQVYLEDISLDEALKRLFNALEKVNGLEPLAGEMVPDFSHIRQNNCATGLGENILTSLPGCGHGWYSREGRGYLWRL